MSGKGLKISFHKIIWLKYKIASSKRLSFETVYCGNIWCELFKQWMLFYVTLETLFTRLNHVVMSSLRWCRALLLYTYEAKLSSCAQAVYLFISVDGRQ